ncbi:hypothetical protein [Psychrobacter immobilis]|uniref:hypothetical protein n=1 Tax=Psychrobacter immobilis TaxID=498 RepID=UPI00191A06D6|nr:hypothetical protein [Psychrobacter immobilis]
MYQYQKILAANDIYSYRRYFKQMLIVVGVLLFSLVNGSVFAFESNPSSSLTCPAGSTKGFLNSNSYVNILDSFTSEDYRNVSSQTTFDGNTTANIPLRIRMSINDIGINNTGNNTTITGTPANPAIDINRNFTSTNSRSNITLDFQNANNSKETYLDKVALSVFDIDKSISRGTGWDDLVKITGVTENDGVIEGRLQTIANSSVIKGTDGLRTSSNSNNNCTISLASDCQGSIVFDKPVKSVTFRYSNTSNVTNPTTQRIQFRLDSYCYTPEYTFTGYVFNDNGGIARSTNPDTKSDVSATFMNNSKYFNGKFDSGELGIYDINLKVRLTDCGPNDGTDITGTTPQTVSNIATTLGQYQFTVPANAIANKPRVCLVQVEPNSWDYSIDTTPNIREVTLKNDVFDYKTEGLVNLDFGEVEADYAAIVLRKAQYVNDCPSALVYSAPTLNTAGNTNTRTGFSESGIGQNSLIPGQCIAYRITATNRANLPVSNFVMRDILQKKGDKGALVTSVLTGPIDNDSNYALTSSVPIGENGTVVTTESVINSKASRRFYFNTKYGTTVNP